MIEPIQEVYKNRMPIYSLQCKNKELGKKEYKGRMEISREEVEIKNIQNLEGIKEGFWRAPKNAPKKVALSFLTVQMPFAQLLQAAQPLVSFVLSSFPLSITF